MGGFTHLHLHTQYSLLDGAIRVKDLFKKTAELGMDKVAVTDHGNMFGAIDLYTEAKAAGTKLLFGCETYVASTDRHDRTNRRNYHLILLAKNDVGYKDPPVPQLDGVPRRLLLQTRASTSSCCAITAMA